MSCGASGPPTAEDGGEKTDHVEGDRMDEDGPEPVERQYREQHGPTPNTTSGLKLCEYVCRLQLTCIRGPLRVVWGVVSKVGMRDQRSA